MLHAKDNISLIVVAFRYLIVVGGGKKKKKRKKKKKEKSHCIIAACDTRYRGLSFTRLLVRPPSTAL